MAERKAKLSFKELLVMAPVQASSFYAIWFVVSRFTEPNSLGAGAIGAASANISLFVKGVWDGYRQAPETHTASTRIHER